MVTVNEELTAGLIQSLKATDYYTFPEDVAPEDVKVAGFYDSTWVDADKELGITPMIWDSVIYLQHLIGRYHKIWNLKMELIEGTDLYRVDFNWR